MIWFIGAPNKMKNLFIVKLLILTVLLLASACAKTVPNYPRSTLDIPTVSITPSQAATFLIETPSPHIETPTLSAPTADSWNAEQQILSLLEDNAGCELPCWWGAIPGVSHWSEVEPFLVALADKIGRGGTGVLKKGDQSVQLENYTFHKKINAYPEDISIAYNVNSEEIIDLIIVDTPGTERRYQTHQILASNGKPAEILLSTIPDTPIGKPWFTLVLLYPEQGVVLVYDGPASKGLSGIKVCPEEPGPKIFLFSREGVNLDLLIKMMEQLAWGNPSGLSPIRAFGDLNIDLVYDELIKPSGCITIKQ